VAVIARIYATSRHLVFGFGLTDVDTRPIARAGGARRVEAAQGIVEETLHVTPKREEGGAMSPGCHAGIGAPRDQVTKSHDLPSF
jgi:hypothetical protein